jgi:hypothetical protein
VLQLYKRVFCAVPARTVELELLPVKPTTHPLILNFSVRLTRIPNHKKVCRKNPKLS